MPLSSARWAPVRSIDPSIRAPSSRTSPPAVKSWMSRTVPPTLIRSAWIARPSPGSMTVSTHSSRPPTWDSHNQIAAVRDWLAVVGSAPVTIETRQVEVPAHVHAVAEQPGQIAPQHGQLLQRGAADLERCLELALFERQWKRDRHRAEVELAGDEGVAQVQAAVVDLVPALPAEAPHQVGRDPAATLAVTAVHGLARPGGLDHELRCDHAPLVGRDHRNVTETAGNRRVECSSAAVHVRCVGAARAPAADWAGGQMCNQDLEVTAVVKLDLTRQADPVLREASK